MHFALYSCILFLPKGGFDNLKERFKYKSYNFNNSNVCNFISYSIKI